MSLGKPGHSPVVDSPIRRPASRARREAGRRRASSDLHPLQHRRPPASRSDARDALDVDRAAGDRRHDRPAAGLDVVAAQACVAPCRRARPFDPDRRRAVALTPTPIARRNWHNSTTCGSQAAWRISVDAAGGRGGEERRLGAGDRRLVEVHRGAGQAVGRLEHVPLRPPVRAHPSPSARGGASRSSGGPGSRRPAARAGRVPRRASSGPSSSTDPRRRPTSAASRLVALDLRGT